MACARESDIPTPGDVMPFSIDGYELILTLLGTGSSLSKNGSRPSSFPEKRLIGINIHWRM